MRIALLLVLSVLTISCDRSRPPGAIEVSVVGDRIRVADPDRAMLLPADRVVLGATAMGLVAIDAGGQVEPALAESWIVTSDGLSTIFRIRDAKWSDGTPVTAEQVAASLNRALAPTSRNALRPLLTSVDAVVAMTGAVVEVRLKVPRPNLLQLLAQPELAIRRDGASGAGPYRIATIGAGLVALDPLQSDDAPVAEDGSDRVIVRAERASVAIARFSVGKSDLVLGGSLANWPLVQVASPRGGRLRFDPVDGLFGLAVSARSQSLASRDVRIALAESIDRRALGDMFGLNGWTTRETLLPRQLDSARLPVQPDWASQTLAERRADARSRMSAGGSRRLTIALPDGPGTRLVLARLKADWRPLGVQLIAVAQGSADADLRLIDAVAPNASANWYLTSVSCAAGLVCDVNGDASLTDSRAADSLSARAFSIAESDAATTLRASYIALGTPVRWALVDPNLAGWRDNALGLHPLAELRNGR